MNSNRQIEGIPPVKITERVMTDYLLGRLRAQEKEQFEEQYFANDETHARLCAIEERLIDSYLCGRLSWRNHRAFENYYLSSPLRVANVEEARVLMRSVAPDSERRGWLWPILAWVSGANTYLAQWVLVSGCVVVVFGCGVLVDRLLQRHSEDVGLVRAKTEQNVSGVVERAKPLIFDILLLPGLMKGAAESSRVLIPRGAEAVRLELRIDPMQTGQYRALVVSAEGRLICSQQGLAVKSIRGQSVVLVLLPLDLLTETDYIIRLQALRITGEPALLQSYSLAIARE
jgi:hypothetical protein